MSDIMSATTFKDLRHKSLCLPTFQRGYRWGREEVEALLNDLWEFWNNSDHSGKEFYCLQPIVVYHNKDKGRYDLLDGQQRLTTFYILLAYFEQYDLLDQFSLTYESRPESDEYLKNRKFATSEDNDRYIDHWHMAEAYKFIREWFRENETKKKAICQLVTAGNDADKLSVKFIEYDLEEGENSEKNPIDVFIRLNQWKIPLTDAELVKALFLQRDKYQDQRKVDATLNLIADEWYQIEKGLEDQDRWNFIAPREWKSATKIELLLDLVAKQELKNKHNKEEYCHPLYLDFAEVLNEKKDAERIEEIERLWKDVKLAYELIDEWYHDHTRYHLVGYLINVGSVQLYNLIHKAKNRSKSDFNAYLRDEVQNVIKCELENLRYQDEAGNKGNHNQIKQILLLHNVQLCIEDKEEQSRFPFSKYKEQKWSLEHIVPQNEKAPYEPAACKEWLKDHLESFKSIGDNDKEVEKKLEEMVKTFEIMGDAKSFEHNKEVYVAFERLLGKVQEIEAKYLKGMNHSLHNLCLLDGGTNSSLSNNSFNVKREKIRAGNADVYIPIATRKVFLKEYTPYSRNNYFWNKEDADAYYEDIMRVYDKYTKQPDNYEE